MAIYSLAQTSVVTVSGNAAADVACSTGMRPRLMEWGLFLGAATASTFSLRRTSALGTRTTPTALIAEDVSDPALAGINLIDMAVAFSVEPTELTTKLRSIGLPATIGTGVIWTFPRGITVATSLSLAIIGDATNAASHHHNPVCDI
ncbi:MAG: hypothetical protein M3R04_10325 [bacterium]|nr:hypothetical protein [bacterium]